MTYTNFPNGATSFGIPLVGGIGGIPFTGNWYFVDAAAGSDGNEGTVDAPLQTIARAYALCTDGNNDVVALMGAPLTSAPTTGTFRLSATLTWAKSATHMIGITAPTRVGQRARIAPLTTATTNINPLFSVTAQGCVFANFSFFQGIGQASTDEQLATITGQRNYFWNVDFGGMGNAAGAARAGSYVILLNGAQENTFSRCTIGVDTIARTAANASVKCTTAATRNIFEDCLFPVYATAATPLVFDMSATGSIDRYLLIRNSIIINSGSSTLTAVIASTASPGGVAVFDNNTVVGAANYAASATDATVKVAGPVPNGHTSGVALSSSTS
jgi:hypothetical protein